MVEKWQFLTRQEKISGRKHYDAVVIGSGMGALTSACLLANDGLSVLIVEQNYLPGGCTSSYWRKGYVFEAGATTLVGLDENMPLRGLLEKIGSPLTPEGGTGFSQKNKILNLENNNSPFEGWGASTLHTIELDLPMKVYLKNGEILERHKNLDKWTAEAERVFGKKNQQEFWEFCYKIARFVWKTSLRQISFPPTRFSDLVNCVKNIDFAQFRYAGYSLFSTEWLLKRFKLLDNEDFVDFVNEQLLITAQNHISEVNVLFGATALCYTNFGNYYVPGGLINLVSPLLTFLENQGSEIHLREEVVSVQNIDNQYFIKTNKADYTADFLISGIPINNTLQLYDNGYGKKIKKKVMKSEQLNSAFQMGIAFRKTKYFDCLHHQIHLSEPLPLLGSKSIFVSLSHPDDTLRCSPDEVVASVSTHIKNPENRMTFDKKILEEFIINELEQKGFFKKEDILYYHSSHPQAWEKWTKRAWGFVGGYPQYSHIKPWQMLDARLDGTKAYICGDTVYPGQGIPGATLSGIIAYEKLKSDWKI